jgi:hypothetical protein
MPLDYLRTLDRASLPLKVTDEHALRCIAVLRAAELIDADIIDDGHGQAILATVHRITHQGDAALASLTSPPA